MLVSIAPTAFASWQAIQREFASVEQLALLSRALRLHQNADMMHDALRADVNAALLVPADHADASERVRLEVLASARQYRADLGALRDMNLPVDLSRRFAQTAPPPAPRHDIERDATVDVQMLANDD